MNGRKRTQRTQKLKQLIVAGLCCDLGLKNPTKRSTSSLRPNADFGGNFCVLCVLLRLFPVHSFRFVALHRYDPYRELVFGLSS